MHLMGELVVQRTHVEALSAEADVPGLGQAMQELTRSSHALQAMVMQIRMIPVDAVFTALPAAGPRRRDPPRQAGRARARRQGDRAGPHGRRRDRRPARAPDPQRARPRPRVARRPRRGRQAADRQAHDRRAPRRRLDRDHGLATTAAASTRQKVAAVAVARGLITREQAQLIDMRAAIELLFAPGFSTAEVGDLSGRGVGMDAVRDEGPRARRRGDVTSVQGEGTVTRSACRSRWRSCPPWSSRPAGSRSASRWRASSARCASTTTRSARSPGGKMLVLKDEALPLRRAVDVFGGSAGRRRRRGARHPRGDRARPPSAAVALSVSKLVGQRELVTRPLPPNVGQEAAVSGARGALQRRHRAARRLRRADPELQPGGVRRRACRCARPAV